MTEHGNGVVGDFQRAPPENGRAPMGLQTNQRAPDGITRITIDALFAAIRSFDAYFRVPLRVPGD
ncbi:MAG: hypothetical protein LBF51_09245 [Zoogloeaceae bacterium]|nr:hypothetical protein [Zoogloeaceae bacterium]